LNRPPRPEAKRGVLIAILGALCFYVLEELLLGSPHYRHVILLGFVETLERVVGAVATVLSFMFHMEADSEERLYFRSFTNEVCNFDELERRSDDAP
jgi:hypothetical protein